MDFERDQERLLRLYEEVLTGSEAEPDDDDENSLVDDHLKILEDVASGQEFSDNDENLVDEKEDEDDEAKFSESMDNEKMDVNIIRYILNQKDIIIEELRDKIKLLNKHINLLNKFNNKDNAIQGETPTNTISKNTEIIISSLLNIQPSKPVLDINTGEPPEEIENKISRQERNTHEPFENNNKQIHITQVSAGFYFAQGEIILKYQINMNDEITSDTNTENNWKTVVNKNRDRTQIVVGSNREQNKVEAVEGTATLYVYHLNPHTIAAALCDLIKKQFPEIKCKQINKFKTS
ncbi:unnamed protein product [Psylliodes chrysocephalus]|uniref:Uncharacterized protein n=1 Tax=Psylliodes chrysocephalus TaxID=3402493 RepID=A0A9P0D5H4_9CUCU|nr:unnamed protein product [Psylliodes chrysocephala]